MNYRTLDFRHKAFGGATFGREWAPICRDFEMRPCKVRDLEEWPGFDAWQKAWIEQWWNGKPPRLVWFHINGVELIDYGVPYQEYVEGRHVQGDRLMATIRVVSVRTRGMRFGTGSTATELTEGVKFGGGKEFTFFPRPVVRKERSQE